MSRGDQRDWLILCLLFGHRWRRYPGHPRRFCTRCLVDHPRQDQQP